MKHAESFELPASSSLSDRRTALKAMTASLASTVLAGCPDTDVSRVSANETNVVMPQNFSKLSPNHIIRTQWPIAKQWMESLSLTLGTEDIRHEKYFPDKKGGIRLWVSVTVRKPMHNEVIIHTVISHSLESLFGKTYKNGGKIDMNVVDSTGRITQSEPSQSGASTTRLDHTQNIAPYSIEFPQGKKD
jgi:hypothetical protein